jgi:hypothetical protein
MNTQNNVAPDVRRGIPQPQTANCDPLTEFEGRESKRRNCELTKLRHRMVKRARHRARCAHWFFRQARSADSLSASSEVRPLMSKIQSSKQRGAPPDAPLKTQTRGSNMNTTKKSLAHLTLLSTGSPQSGSGVPPLNPKSQIQNPKS